MSYSFKFCEPSAGVCGEDWSSWQWQLRNGLKSASDFSALYKLSPEQQSLFRSETFKVQSTPYYAQVALKLADQSALYKILVPDAQELATGGQQMLDPLGEKEHSPVPRIIHRYTDRCLLLLTDTCSVYCRYCTRKHFTGKEAAYIAKGQYVKALDYIANTTSLREVILSGGDPLTLSDGRIEAVLKDLKQIDHIHLVRIATRMPVVAPMRITPSLLSIFQKYKPIFLMTHFNHPEEITLQAAQALENLVDHGVPTFNQLVLLNGINNSSSIIRELHYRLVSLRVKPYYMFQCDPSEGSDHFRTPVSESLRIQRELWGSTSGLAMANLSLDIPGGGGKVGLVPDFLMNKTEETLTFKGWDGKKGVYLNPGKNSVICPPDDNFYT